MKINNNQMQSKLINKQNQKSSTRVFISRHFIIKYIFMLIKYCCKNIYALDNYDELTSFSKVER